MKLLTPNDADWSMLFRPAERVTDYARQVLPHIQGMRRLIEHRDGGYAICGPQVGVPYAFFLWGGRHWKSALIQVCVNPILKPGAYAVEVVHKNEGCMSWPGRRRDVERWNSVTMLWETSTGDVREQTTEWTQLAYTWQHECDHLRGSPLWLQDGSDNPEFNVKSE